jgi:hypothetical protein
MQLLPPATRQGVNPDHAGNRDALIGEEAVNDHVVGLDARATAYGRRTFIA